MTSSTARLSHVTRASSNQREAMYTVPGALNSIPDMNTGQVVEIVRPPARPFSGRRTRSPIETNLATQFSTGKVLHSLATGSNSSGRRAACWRDWTGLGVPADLSKQVNQTAAGVPAATTVVGTSPYQPNPHRPITGYAPVYAFVDQVRVDTGALYLYDTARSSYLAGHGRRPTGALSGVHSVLARATGIVSPFEVSDTLLTGKLGLVFKPAPTGSVYVSWGLAALPPGTSSLSNDNGSRNNGTPGTTGQNAPGANAQESYNYELGTKWDVSAETHRVLRPVPQRTDKHCDGHRRRHRPAARHRRRAGPGI